MARHLYPFPQVRVQQPQGPVRINRDNLLGRTVTHCIPLNGVNKEIVRGTDLTIASTGSMGNDYRGRSLRGDGSNACASIPLDLSAYNKLSLSFSMYWDTFANDDDVAMEFTPNFSVGSGGFLILPNSSGVAGTFLFGAGSGGNNSSRYFPRPSAARWYRYTFLLDRTTNASPSASAVAAYVDGIAQTLTDAGSDFATGNFTSDALYLLSRNNASLFGAGRLQNIAIRGGYLMSAAEAAEDARNPWQIYAPVPRWLRVGSATVQLLRPASDISAGAWTPSSGATLAPMLDEVAFDDADYITTGSASTSEVAFGTGIDPTSSAGHTIRYRARGAGTLTVTLRQGATLIATHTPTLTGSFQTFSFTLSGAEADSITNYADLRLRFVSS